MLNSIIPLYKVFFLAVLLLAISYAPASVSSTLPIMRGVGGDFTEASSLGYKISLSDYKDKVVLLTFGYTNCPDICPITLGYLDFIYSKLTPQQQKEVEVMFITVDPDYDDPNHMAKYMRLYNDHFIGISPEKQNLPKIANQFGVSYTETNVVLPTRYNRVFKTVSKDDTTKAFNHSVSIFLLDTKNQVRGIYYSGSDSDAIVAEIGKLLADNKTNTSNYKNNITAKNFWIRLIPKASKITAMYGEIINNTDKTIYLTDVSCLNISEQAELHLTKIENNQTTMTQRLNVPIMPHSTFVLKPMHHHVMLMGLQRPLIKNERVDCSLGFDNIPNITISAIVKKQTHDEYTH